MPNATAASLRVSVMLVTLVSLVAIGDRRSSTAAEGPPTAKKATPAKKTTPAKKPAPKKAAAQAPVTALEAVKEVVEGEDVREFRAFCDSWMQKLRERDIYNVANIKWEKTSDGGVAGEYLSYGTQRTCIAREEPGKDPIGKITYREIKYRKQGPTPAAATAGANTIVEQTDVTEIFRYAKGHWLY